LACHPLFPWHSGPCCLWSLYHCLGCLGPACLLPEKYPELVFGHSSLFVGPELNLWTYNFVEVSGCNLESSQTWGYCLDFLNHREGGVVFFIRFSSFLLYSVQLRTVEILRGCVSLKK
jgi:hypothetical protein